MSGGSLDYVYRDVEQAVRDGYVDGDAETVVMEIGQLLHDIEWSASGDYSAHRWRQTLAEFCSSWEGGYEDTLERKLAPKFDLEHSDRIVDMGGRTWGLSRRLYDFDTDERLYEFVRLGDDGRQTVVLEQSEVHEHHEVLFDEERDSDE